jgi:signal transduction histidine kinase
VTSLPQESTDPLGLSAASLYALIDGAPFGVYIVNSSFRIAQINAAAQKHAFRNVNPALGRDFSEAVRVLWPEARAVTVIDQFRHTLDTGEPFHSQDDIHLRADSADVEAYDWELQRIALPDGSFGVVCYYFDCSRLHQADRRKDEFLAMLAHELRNPLTAISYAARILRREDATSTSVRSACEILDRQVENMVRQVDDLLDANRIGRGRLELRKERTDVRYVVSNAIEATRPHCESMGHALTVTLPPRATYVHGDAVRLAQVVGNLLNNAYKFTNKRGRIGLTVEELGSEIVIRVQDTGIGIAAAEVPRVFEMFGQVDQSPARRRDGLGLGLALVKDLVELHSGTVEARSAGVGRGSEFLVYLPALTGPPPPEPSAPSSELSVIPRRVLVADNNRDAAMSLAMLLKMMGHEADTVHDGLEAVSRAMTFRADVILIELHMPRLNGYEAAREIRKRGQKAPMLVALMARAEEEERRLSEEAGFDAHLVKPVDAPALTKLLAAVGGG